MTPPGWRTPPSARATSDTTYSHLGQHRPAESPASDDSIIASRSGEGLSLPTPKMTAYSGPLWPGLHIVVGAHGSGKTQFLLQMAIQNALLGQVTHVELPEVAPSEASLRIASILSNTPWGKLADKPSDENIRHFDTLEGAPITLQALRNPSEAALEIIPPSAKLVIIDPSPSESKLSELRFQAIQNQTVVLVAGRSCQPQTGQTLSSGLEWAKAFGASDATIALSDSLWCLVPEYPSSAIDGRVPLQVMLAKSRRAQPQSLPVVFNGARFMDEDPEMELEFERSELTHQKKTEQ